MKRFEELRYCGTLPSSSGIGLFILRLTARSGVKPDELADVLRLDPALSGRILRLANIARGQGAPAVADVETAVRALAPATLHSAALGFSLLHARRTSPAGQFDHDAYWSHAIASAHAAEAIARENGTVPPSHAFTCALLARIGMLALATVHAEAFERLLVESRGRPVESLLIEETRRFDIHHWEVSAAILSEWGLPEVFAAAVASLGSPRAEAGLEDPVSEPLSDVLREASLVAHRLLEGLGMQGALGDGWLELLLPVGGGLLSRDRLVAIGARMAPLWRADCDRLRLPASTPAETDEDLHAASGGDAEAGERTTTPARGPGRVELEPSDVRVLAVDDDPRMLQLLEHNLKAAGYRVSTASDGETAMRMILEDAPHLLLTDWIMPGMSGGDLLRELRATDLGRRVYGIVLTARDDEDQVVEAFDAGADDFVAKPFDPRVLMARIAAAHRTVSLQRRIQSDRERRSGQVVEMGLMTRQLHAAAHVDVLTALPNRRYAMERLEQEFMQAVRYDRHLCVLMVDIDHFKAVNDRHGHHVGDDVLKATAAVLRQYTRRGDVVCRLGGEEFLVINVDSDPYGAVMCAERLRASVSQNVVRSHGLEFKVTISVGVASRSGGAASVEELLKHADDAVYAAKSAGRNCVRSFRPRLPETA
jgi:diguanylate cyclase (GGDEF)-like protein